MGNKKKFDTPYVGIDQKSEYPILYDKYGNYSVFLKIENPVLQYAGDKEKYYDYNFIFNAIIKLLGAGFVIQKQDILSKHKFQYPNLDKETDYLSQKFFNHFQGREYTKIVTYLIITGETNRSRFFSWDQVKYRTFVDNITKIIQLFKGKNMRVNILNKKQIETYLWQYLAFQFASGTSVNNFETKKNSLKIGDNNINCISLVDIEEVELPSVIKPFKNTSIAGRQFPVDLFNFFYNVPEINTIVYNQVVQIPYQKGEINKLDAKKRKHKSMPDPANDLCVEDIDQVLNDIARDGQTLVYSHFDIIISGTQDLSKACNYIESSLFESGVMISKQAYNQFELFRASLPGNTAELKDYDRFLTTSDVAVNLMFKERLTENEISNSNIYFVDRQGIPIAIDLADVPMLQGRINNRNKFILGPSGSGKSFFMNFILRQYFLLNYDIVLIDTGHSYSGLCEYYKGKYITYSEKNPITMNPFRIAEIEYNEEKREFLKSLIALLWKGVDGSLTQVEDTLLSKLIASYYNSYFRGKDGNKTPEEIKDILKVRWMSGIYNTDFIYFIETHIGEDVHEKLKAKYSFSEDDFEGWVKKVTEGEEHYRDQFLKVKYKEYVDRQQQEIRFQVDSLSFNTFFEFALQEIPCIVDKTKQNGSDGINFNLGDFEFILGAFYKGGEYEKTLNDEFDRTLFDEKFVVFEIDAIKEHKKLFPIVTLIIMDVFIQKMRLKNNRKALIIEEAWKAIASPMMAGYILYLYKTVRKFWGEAMVVTQELNDIIGNAVVKDSIIANSDTIILLDQTKFKDKFGEIADILSLNEVEQNKLFTVNNLDNKSNRSFFREVYIKRGSEGEVYDIESSPYEYFTFTTEKPEKDAVQVYLSIYKDITVTLDNFVKDLQNSGLSKTEFITIINSLIPAGCPLKEFQQKKDSLIQEFNISDASLNDFINSKKKLKQIA